MTPPWLFGDIPGLLRPCSPVLSGWSDPGVVLEARPQDDACVVAYMRITLAVPLTSVYLRLDDATGRYHACLWLSEKAWPGSGHNSDDLDDDLDRQAMLSGAWRLEPHLRGGRSVGVRWGIWATGEWLDWGSGLSPERDVKTLADLDPNDPRLLPDGSRWVDAEALRRVVLFVAQKALPPNPARPRPRHRSLPLRRGGT